MIVFTSICANYGHKARTLAQSVHQHMPDTKFVVCLLEREVPKNMPAPYFDHIVLAKDAWEGDFDRFIFKHSIVEASTAVKGQFFKYLYEAFPNESQFVYLDPDCFVYSDLAELKTLLKEKPIILCPHLLKPGNIDMELSSTAHGVYNLGFLAVNRSDEAKRLIHWWAERLYLYCYDDISRGIFTDQKWMDLAPCFFDTYILKHHGYDLAPWSLLQCAMEVRSQQAYVEGDPLRFIHFSGYGSVAENCMADWMRPEDHPFRDLYAAYSVLHEQNDVDRISATPWSYSVYLSGEKVDDAIRKAYRCYWDVMVAQENPFACGNKYFYRKLNARKDSLGKKAMRAARKWDVRVRNGMRLLRTQGMHAFMRKLGGKIAKRLR